MTESNSITHPKRFWVSAIAIVVGVIMLELLLDRKFWGVSGEWGFWSGDINSSHNSQFLLDPYSFTHIVHGILLYALLFPFKKLSWSAKILIALGIESAWELIENTDAVIELYRAATISLDYYGDSIVNSMSDIALCMVGFFMTARLPRWASIGVLVALEGLLLFFIRDSLVVNIIMLAYPLDAIKQWQLMR